MVNFGASKLGVRGGPGPLGPPPPWIRTFGHMVVPCGSHNLTSVYLHRFQNRVEKNFLMQKMGIVNFLMTVKNPNMCALLPIFNLFRRVESPSNITGRGLTLRCAATCSSTWSCVSFRFDAEGNCITVDALSGNEEYYLT